MMAAEFIKVTGVASARSVQAEVAVSLLRLGACAGSLVKLPRHFDVLLCQLCRRECSACGRLSKEPALCLVCGAFMCAGPYLFPLPAA